MAAQEVQSKTKGSKGLPKGVIEVPSRKPGAPPKYQARVNVVPADMPPGTKKKPRGLGLFTTVNEAASAVATAEAKLKAGVSPWAQEQRKNKHKRNEVRLRTAHCLLQAACSCSLTRANLCTHAAGTASRAHDGAPLGRLHHGEVACQGLPRAVPAGGARSAAAHERPHAIGCRGCCRPWHAGHVGGTVRLGRGGSG